MSDNYTRMRNTFKARRRRYRAFIREVAAQAMTHVVLGVAVGVAKKALERVSGTEEEEDCFGVGQE